MGQDGLRAVAGPEVGQVCAGVRGRGEHLLPPPLRHPRLPGPGLPDHGQVSMLTTGCMIFDTVLIRSLKKEVRSIVGDPN